VKAKGKRYTNWNIGPVPGRTVEFVRQTVAAA